MIGPSGPTGDVGAAAVAGDVVAGAVDTTGRTGRGVGSAVGTGVGDKTGGEAAGLNCPVSCPATGAAEKQIRQARAAKHEAAKLAADLVIGAGLLLDGRFFGDYFG